MFLSDVYFSITNMNTAFDGALKRAGAVERGSK